MKKRRIGIFGGTFDPVHQGHIEVALRVRSLLSLDWVDFVPAYHPPHKRSLPDAGPWHRFAMLVLATIDHEGLSVSTIELETGEAAYTIDTIGRVKGVWGDQADFFFIMGADSFQAIMSWKENERLLESCHFVVMTRPGYSLTAHHLPASVRGRITDVHATRSGNVDEPGYRIYLCGDMSNPVSSTTLRQALRERQAVEDIPPLVWKYIAKYQLYQETDETDVARCEVNSMGRCG